MTSALNENEGFVKVLSKVINRMLDDIKISHANGHVPLVVAVSRRMPHVLFWYKECIASSEIKQQLDRVEIITEIALPFIDFSESEKIYDVFLIDDMVNTGNTFNYINTLIESFSGKKTLMSYVFFLKTKTFTFEYLESGEIFVGKEYETSEYRSCCEFITTIIAATLPIDVTYPLLYFKEVPLEFNFGIYKKKFKDAKSKDIENYEVNVAYRTSLALNDNERVEDGDVNESYTSLLSSEISGSLNNDFAKIRAYMRLGKFIVVPYAPNILSDDQLQDEDLFQCHEYKNIWRKALDVINPDYFEDYDIFEEDSQSKEIIGNRSRRSMVCIANYLYSLSSFNRVLNNSSDKDFPGFKIDRRDIDLIVGVRLADEIYPLINEILAEKLESPKAHQKIRVASTLIPEVYDEEYTISKYMCVKGRNMQEDLIAVLKNAREQKKNYPSVFTEDMEYDIEGIMESFESLEKAFIIRDLERKVELYKWVDKKIDECVIVSRYAYTYDENYVRYWRRFFRMTSMEIE